MVKSKISIRPYRLGDEIGINALYQKVFQEKRTLKEWQWKYVDNPAVIDPADWIVVAEANDEILGHYASFVCKMKAGSRVLHVPQPVDSMMDPEARLGIKTFVRCFKKSVEAYGNFADFGFGFPNQIAYPVGKRFLRYRDLGQMVPLFKRLSIRTVIQRRLSWLPSAILERLHRLSNMLVARYYGIKIASCQILTGGVDLLDEGIDHFWEAVKDRYAIATIRNRSYFQWRFRASHYNVIVLKGPDGIRGYGIIRVRATPEARIGYILDLFCRIDSDYPVLLAGLYRELALKGADFALCALLPDDPMAEPLKRGGLQPHHGFKPFPVVYFPFFADTDTDFLGNPRNWHLTYGDIDSY